jgi:adenylate kinase family enzyme
MPPQRDLLLITGIPGTGKTTYGDKFVNQFGFVHYDLEEPQTLNRFAGNPARFIADAVSQKKSVVVTWGFVLDEYQTALVLQFRSVSFKLIWFDGNRSAALRAFRKRATVSEEAFHAQMHRIEETKIVERLQPTVINPLNAPGKFKSPKKLLKEMRKA